MRTPLAVLVLILLVLPGCDLLGTSDGDFRLFTDRDAYTLDDTMQVWFQNDSREPAAVDLCGAAFELRAGPTWVPLPGRQECDLILLALSTDNVVGRDVPIAAYLDTDDFEAGTYRFSATLHLEESQRRLVSEGFELSE